ncbi:MAG TPA: DUF167 domain-containing protein [Bacteroidia bacterium]|jgi:hypothetical protein|nr:DUF167 domain-containing protein [Bacteroidia bacterium]HRG53540.1 DUF167 domain-containing protein [Bacteroidia bacterium]
MIRITVQVKPNSSKDEIHLDENGNMIIKIKEAPVEGAANSYLLKFLSKELTIKKSLISLEKGATSRFKKICLNIDPSTFEECMKPYKK